MTQRVLVIGDDRRIALAIARSLGRTGLQVDIAWNTMAAVLASSRYVSKTLELPLPSDEPAWTNAVSNLLADGTYELAIPATECALFALHRSRDVLRRLTRLAVPNHGGFTKATSKSAIGEIAERLGIPIPSSRTIANQRQLDTCLQELTEKTVIKPVTSIDSSVPAEKLFVQIARTDSDCRRIMKPLLAKQIPAVFQQWIPGHGEGVCFLAREGRLLTAFQHRRLHETSGHGSTYRESVAIDPELHHATARIISELGYTGVGMCEFRRDPDSGRWWFLELNPRFWGSLPLAVAAGADFPADLYEMLVNGRTEFDSNYRIGLRHRDLTGDLRWVWRTLRKGRSTASASEDQAVGWAISPVSRLQLIREMLRFVSCRDAVDSFCLDDPRPLFAELAAICSHRRRSKRSRSLNLKEHSSQPRPSISKCVPAQELDDVLTAQ